MELRTGVQKKKKKKDVSYDGTCFLNHQKRGFSNYRVRVREYIINSNQTLRPPAPYSKYLQSSGKMVSMSKVNLEGLSCNEVIPYYRGI